MKIREKVLAIGIPFALILFLSLSYIELSMTKKAVEESSKIMLEQKEQAFNKMLELLLKNLETLCTDWAVWDDTYVFITSGDEKYVRSNLGENTFRNAKINVMVFMNNNGEVVFSKFYDSDWNEREIPKVFLSEELLGKSGYLYFEGAIVVLASERITTSDGKAEPRGYLLMGRILSAEEFEEIGNTLGVKAEIVPFKGEKELADKIVGYLEIKDILGKKVFVRLEQKNPIFPIFLNNLLLALGFFALTSLSILIAAIMVVDRGIVSKIVKLEEFTQKADLKDRIELSGSEELVNLAKGVNSMLERIEKNESELRFLLKILRHDLMNAFTSIKGYIELYKAENNPEFLEKAEKSLERGMNVINVVKQLEVGEMREVEIRKAVEELTKYYQIEAEIRGNASVIVDDGIYTIFGNLIENAIKHGNATKVFVEIEKGDMLVVRFSDNGRGFTERTRANVFKEGNSEKSTGLGLFIVKKLMERYGGFVELQGKNTLVLRFPLHRCSNPRSLTNNRSTSYPE